MLKKIERVVFICAFVICIFLPLLRFNIKRGTVLESENRMPAARPSLHMSDGSLNSRFTSEFENWFDDRIGFRSALVAQDGWIQFHLFDRIPGMILGKHHELTLISDMREYQHTNLCTSAQLFQITSAYETIASFLQSQKIQFYYMQCWDNFSIYPERYPDNIKVFGDCSRTQQIEDALASETSVRLVKIRDALIQGKEKYETYPTWGEPWHWTQRGAFIGYQKLMETINRYNDGKYSVLDEEAINIGHEDLGKTYFGVHEPDVLETFTLKKNWGFLEMDRMTYQPEGGDENHFAYYVNNHVDNEDTLLIIGDSYIYDYQVLQDLAESFHRTIMVNGSSAESDHFLRLMAEYHPDIVLMENAQRVPRYDKAVSIAENIRGHAYQPSETISFSENGNFGDYVIEGFADPEKDGAWVEGNRMALLLSLSSGINQQKISCSVKICSVLGQKGQQVRVSVNGLACADARMTTAGDLTFSFDRPPSDYVLLHFELPDAVSPLDLGESGDSRKLSLKISALELS